MKKTRLLISAMSLVLMTFVSASNMSISDLVNSYDYDYSDGSLNITSFSNLMLDLNNNSINDTLVIGLTTNASASETYLFIVSLEEGGSLSQNYTNKTVNSSSPSVNVTFSSKSLKLSKYNYSVDVRKQDYLLIYSKYNLSTSQYNSYEGGDSVSSITDENVGNSQIRVNVSLNITANRTSNITVFLRYGNKSISASTQSALTTPSTQVSVDFNNETIKSTHYGGIYTINKVQVDDNLLDTSHTTASYDFETFAKTSYIINSTSYTIDNNSNNLTDALRFNVTLNVKSTDDYNLKGSIYDSEGEFVSYVSENMSLSSGIQTVDLDLMGTELYSTYKSSEFELANLILSINDTTVDIIQNAHTTEFYSYFEFERPPLPDLNISMNVTDNGTAHVVNLSIKNIGAAPAFSFLVDLIDNSTYSSQESVAFLDVNESVNFTFYPNGTYPGVYFVAIVDLGNSVDESNETNNIADNYVQVNITEQPSSLNVLNITLLYSGTSKIYEAIIENNGNSTISTVNWTFNTGEQSIGNSNSIGLAPSQQAALLFAVNYSSGGWKNVSLLAYNSANSSINDTYSSQFFVGGMQIGNFSQLHQADTDAILELMIVNIDNSPLSGVNWSVNISDGTGFSSTDPLSLGAYEATTILFEHNFTSVGNYIITVNASDGANWYGASFEVSVTELEIGTPQLLSTSGTAATLEFVISNAFSTSKTFTWSFDTNNTGVIWANQAITLPAGANTTIILANNFTANGTYTIIAMANTSLGTYSESLSVTI